MTVTTFDKHCFCPQDPSGADLLDANDVCKTCGTQWVAATPPPTTFTTASGRTRVAKRPIRADEGRIVGLDPDGRIVVLADWMDGVAFALTLCCDAYDKGVEDGVVCRSCYSYDEIGDYIPPAADGTYPGVDPIADPAVPSTITITVTLPFVPVEGADASAVRNAAAYLMDVMVVQAEDGLYALGYKDGGSDEDENPYIGAFSDTVATLSIAPREVS